VLNTTLPVQNDSFAKDSLAKVNVMSRYAINFCSRFVGLSKRDLDGRIVLHCIHQSCHYHTARYTDHRARLQ
jgi:hypothetical protein